MSERARAASGTSGGGEAGDAKSAGLPICTAGGCPEGVRHTDVPHEFDGVEHDMGGAVPEGVLESNHDLPAVIDREAFVRDGWAGDVAAQAFEGVPVMGFAHGTRMKGEPREPGDTGVVGRRAGREEGARLATGGDRPEAPALANGFFVCPTVFDGVDDSMRIAREEIFGPVMSVFTWSDHEEVLARANALPYGLTAAIVTNDLDKAMETADRVEAGYVWINSTGRYLGAPYGGWKHSGSGREESLDELLSYTRIKNVNLRW